MTKTSRRALYIDGLTVAFGDFRAIDNLSLLVNFDEVRAIIGPNGAGKTTLLDVITGKTRPTAGRVVAEPDRDLLRLTDVKIALGGIGRKFQKPSVFEALTVLDNLKLALRSARRSLWAELAYNPTADDRSLIDRVLAEIDMTGAAYKPASTLSHGEKQWLEIGLLLVQQPAILLLDEPVAGMTDQETERTAALVRRIKSADRAVVVIEHDMAFVGSIADVVTVLHEGQLLLEGSMADVSADPRVIGVYLGR